MAATLFIPKKIRVGYQERHGTFTGKLAYVIYYDEKGKLRKEKSWEGWRDKKIEPQEFENTPMTGFIFNKGIQRSSEWFGSGRTVFRLYAPHDFEFEINGDNLINLLMHADVSKREILEPCVFAWSGTELILLPTNSVEYQESVQYTARQNLKVSAKELIKGATYARKKQNETLIYIGHYDWYQFKYDNGKRWAADGSSTRYCHKSLGKKHIFYSVNYKKFEALGPAVLSNCTNTEVVENYSHLVDEFFKLWVSQPFVDCKITPFKYNSRSTNDPWFNRSYPTMYRLDTVANRLHQISVRYDGRWTEKPNRGYVYDEFEKAFFKESIIELDFDPSLSTKSIKFAENGRYNGREYVYPTEQHINLHHSLKPQAELDNITYNTLTPAEYSTLMSKLGYGFPNYILQNGTEVPFKTSYYY